MEPLTPHYITLRLMKLPDIVKLNTCLLLYDYLNDDKIPSFSLTSCSEQHTYYTRSALSDQLVTEPFCTNLRRFCLSISGKYFWNNIPLSIRQKTSKQVFKNALKSYYAAQY